MTGKSKEHVEEPSEDESALFKRAHALIALDNTDLARILNVHRKTISRWVHGQTSPGHYLGLLAPLVYPHDPALATRLHAYAARQATRLGIQPPPPPNPEARREPAAESLSASPLPAPPPHARKLRADGVLCAACEAMDASPRAVRPALFAAVRYARKVGATLEELEQELAPRVKPVPIRKKPR